MIAEFSAGKIVNDSFKLYLRHFPALFVITFICCLPLFALTWIISTSPTLQEQLFWSVGVILMASLLVTPLSTGAVTHAVYQSLRGRSVGVSESLSIGFRRFLPLLGVAVCTALFVSAGLVLLIIPGLMLAALLYVASPVCVVERKGVFESMQRSRTLTSGRKWQVFVIMFGINILMGIFDRIVNKGFESAAAPTTAEETSSFLTYYLLIQFVLQAITTGWNATAAALSYYHLRSLHESVDIEDIANVFD